MNFIADPPKCPVCHQIVCKDYKWCQQELSAQRQQAREEDALQQEWDYYQDHDLDDGGNDEPY